MLRNFIGMTVFAAAMSGVAAASAPVDSSLRPLMRPGSGAGGEVVSMMRVSAVTPTLRPVMRPETLNVAP